MSETDILLVNQFQGLDVRGRLTPRTTRRPLDTCRDLRNFYVDEYQNLVMPDAEVQVIGEFGETDVKTIWYTARPRGIVVQLDDGRVYYYKDGKFDEQGERVSGYLPGDEPPLLLVTLDEDARPWNIWVNSLNTSFLFGCAARGIGNSGGGTWEVTAAEGESSHFPEAVSVTNLSSSQPFNGEASYSSLYKGRRFVIQRGKRVWFSNLNDTTTFESDSNFTVGGDNQGTNYHDYPGDVAGMVAWEDVLIIFMSSSLWLLTGSSPDTFQLREVQTTVGNSSPWTLMRVEEGVITYGGTYQKDRGIYLFTGSNAAPVSGPVDGLIGGRLFASLTGGYYVLSTGRNSENSIQALIYDYRRQIWTSFDGWRRLVTTQGNPGTFLSDQGDVYLRRSDFLPRKAGRNAKATFGWEDLENPAGWRRFMGVKVSCKKSGSGTPRMKVTARSTEGHVITSTEKNITTDNFNNLVFPLNVRGHAVDFDVEIIPTDDSQSVVIESLQLIVSQKGEKLSRA